MRILYVTPAYKPAYRMGGPIVSMAAVAERLARKGHEVTVATTNANLDEDLDVPLDRFVEIEGVNVRYFRRTEPLRRWLPFVPYVSRSMGYAYSPAMKDGLEALVPRHDLVHVQMPFVYPTYAAARAAFRHGKPLFYHQHGNYLPTHLARRRRKKDFYLALVEKRLMRRATALIALTEAERVAFRSLAPETPCWIVPNGVDVPADDPGAVDRVRVRHGIPLGATLILFLARLHPWKGIDELIGAWAAMQPAHPDVYLVAAGVDECGAERRWRPIAEKTGFSDRLVFAGVVSGQAKADLLHRADLFCLPSSGEGLSIAVLEALAHSTAVMLSPGCNMPELERAGAGVIVPKDCLAMTRALEDLVRDRDRLRTMGQAGRDIAVRDYSWDTVTNRLIELYARACVGEPAATR